MSVFFAGLGAAGLGAAGLVNSILNMPNQTNINNQNLINQYKNQINQLKNQQQQITIQSKTKI